MGFDPRVRPLNFVPANDLTADEHYDSAVRLTSQRKYVAASYQFKKAASMGHNDAAVNHKILQLLRTQTSASEVEAMRNQFGVNF